MGTPRKNPIWKSPVALPAATSSLTWYRTIAMVGFFASVTLDGVLAAAGATPWKHALAAFPMAMAATMWCTVDASYRGEYYPHSLRWVTMMTWPISVPVYLMETRKARGLLLIALGIAGSFGMELVGYAVGVALYRGV